MPVDSPAAFAGAMGGMPDISQLRDRVKKIALRHPIWAAKTVVKLAGPQAAVFLPGILLDLAKFERELEEKERKKAEEKQRKAEEKRRMEEARQTQQAAPGAAQPQAPVYAAPSGPGIGSKIAGGTWRALKGMFESVVPETAGRNILRAVLILGAALAFYVLLKRLGIRAPFNISFIVIFGIAAAVYELAPGPIGKLFKWVSLLFGGFVGFWTLAIGPFSPSIAKWATLTWLVLYTVLFFSILGFKKGMGVLVFNAVIFGLLFTNFYNGMYEPGTPLHTALRGQQSAWSELYTDIKGAGKEAYTGLKRQYFSGFDDYALGVEENRDRPLGVYLRDIGATSDAVSMDDTINVFATLKSLSFKTDEKLEIDVVCYEEGFEDMPDKKGIITPRSKFPVKEDEEQPIDCNIDALHLGPGSHNIAIEATFGFVTSSFLKGYFMLQDQIRSYKSQHPEEGANPLDEFGIIDKNPFAVYTGGPLYIGIRVGLQPIPLPEENFGPTLTVTLDRNPGWEGDLMNVKKFTVAVPPGLKVTKVSGRSVADGNYCQVKDNGEDTCVLDKPEILDRLFPKFEKPILLKKNIRVETLITDKKTLMANAPLAMRSFKVSIDYDFRIKKIKDVTVQVPKKLETKPGGIA